MAEPVTVSLTVNAPPERVLAAVGDLENPDRWANEARSAEILERDDRGRPTRVVVTLGALGFTTAATYTVAYGSDSVTLTCVDGALIRSSTITYTAHGRGDGSTSLQMASTMQVSVPVPQWGLTAAMKRSAEKNLQSIRADVEPDPA